MTLSALADQEAAPSAVVHLDVAPAAAVPVDAPEGLERGFWGALALAQADRLERLIGRTGMRAVSKIVSLLLAAIAVAMVRRALAG